ncbi:copper chaperone PCu(A)C [Asticcacaulis sp. AC466]|uniref:copper chaperone PCu(A)C n=1 Tax=Asticcacaulis sp. AC466 TaxID=1282362 RepID=UPI0004CF3A11|nr:copper chaperone PCu(A)C [Asticcacaulis sp. AC466]
MKKFAVAAVACLSLAGMSACEKVEKTTTRVEKSTDINGVVKKSSLEMTNYAMRSALGNNPNTAAYVTITNKGNSEDQLISASCTCAATTTLHTMKMNGSVMEMAEAKDGFVIKSGETITFVPGGNHIMLENLTERPQAGQTVDVTLAFKNAGPVTLHMPVSDTPLAKAGTSGAMDHGDMKM